MKLKRFINLFFHTQRVDVWSTIIHCEKLHVSSTQIQSGSFNISDMWWVQYSRYIHTYSLIINTKSSVSHICTYPRYKIEFSLCVRCVYKLLKTQIYTVTKYSRCRRILLMSFNFYCLDEWNIWLMLAYWQEYKVSYGHVRMCVLVFSIMCLCGVSILYIISQYYTTALLFAVHIFCCGTNNDHNHIIIHIWWMRFN